jgi:hypothetical protein
VTPVEWTRRRLHPVPASFFVILAAEFLKRRNTTTASREAIIFLTAGIREKFATQASRAIPR